MILTTGTGAYTGSYTPAILQEVDLYMKNWNADGDVIPSIEGLAVYLGVSRTTVDNWQKEENKADFCEAVARLLTLQAKIMLNRGLEGKFNSTVTKLLLNPHGYIEKSDITSGGDKLNLSEGLMAAIDKAYGEKETDTQPGIQPVAPSSA